MLDTLAENKEAKLISVFVSVWRTMNHLNYTWLEINVLKYLEINMFCTLIQV